MGKKLSFIEVKNPHIFLNNLANKKDRLIFNFLNSHDLYFFVKEPEFRDTFDKNSVNFIDGFVISAYLSLLNRRKIKRISGPNFIIDFLKDMEYNQNKKQLFIGLEKKDLKKLVQKFPHLKLKNLFCYNPPYIKDIKFPKKEINKIAKIIKSKKIDFVWIGIGCPKQNILTYDLYYRTKTKYFFNVGAALDFLLEKKKRAPKVIRLFGIEWLYRFITDFKHSKKKVWRSFVSLLYLNKIELTR